MMLACLAFLPACISGEFDRVDIGHQPAQAQFYGLRVGESSMQQCIEALGAPIVVRESGVGADLVWGWERNSGFGVTTSVPIGQGGSANLSYAAGARGAHGWTLKFDKDWLLVSMREGRLKELLEMSSQPARLVESEGLQ
ncbi:MAG: hypothetical protein ACI9X4_002008 [Glaciecola sp.]|jgi:hypothetical protein